MDVQSLADDLAHCHAGVQRGGGVLEDNLHLAAVGQHIDLPALGNLDVLLLTVLTGGPGILSLENGFAAVLDAAGGGGVELENGSAQGGLAAAGLTHQTQGLAPADKEGHVLHRLDAGPVNALDRKVFFQVVHLNQDVILLTHGRSPPDPVPASPVRPCRADPVPAASRRSGGPRPAPRRGASSAGRSSWHAHTGGRRGSPRGD